MITFLLSVIAIGVIIGSLSLVSLWLQGRVMGHMAVNQLNTINDTYMAGYEALSITLARLEDRVIKLEEYCGSNGTSPIDRS